MVFHCTLWLSLDLSLAPGKRTSAQISAKGPFKKMNQLYWDYPVSHVRWGLKSQTSHRPLQARELILDAGQVLCVENQYIAYRTVRWTVPMNWAKCSHTLKWSYGSRDKRFQWNYWDVPHLFLLYSSLNRKSDLSWDMWYIEFYCLPGMSLRWASKTKWLKLTKIFQPRIPTDVTEVLDSTLKKSFPGIFNFTVGILA